VALGSGQRDAWEGKGDGKGEGSVGFHFVSAFCF